jgi:alpha-galactosidase
MKALSAYVHSKGLKLGIYSSPGPRTCGGFEGSHGFEEKDAQTWADWGIDFLKYDWCSARQIYSNDQMQAVYLKMALALRKTGRPIVYSICQYGEQQVQQWAPSVGGNLWRTTFDIRASWDSMSSIGFRQAELAPFAKPGHWNDPDMLEVGNEGLNHEEQKTHFTLWAMLASPLLAGNDVRSMSPEVREILLNKEVIAINQDSLGKQATRLASANDLEVWSKPLSRGKTALAFFNRSAQPMQIKPDWATLGVKGARKLRDLWAHQDLNNNAASWKAEIPPHGVVLLRID